MTAVSRFISVLLACAFLLAITNCTHGKRTLCCIEVGEDNASKERSYCLDHEVAVQMFIQEPVDTAAQRERLRAFERFFEMSSVCNTVECIQAAIDTTSLVPDLKPIYDEEHADSEEDLQIEQAEKAELIKCGFQHAIDVGIGS